MNKQQWIDYINKKIDQELNARKHSGLTSWALIGAVVALLNSSINDLSDFYNLETFRDWTLIITVICFDLLYLGSHILNLVPKFELDFKDVKTSSRYDNFVEIDTLVTAISMYLILAILNFLVIRKFDYELNFLPYGILIVFLLFQSTFSLYFLKTRYKYIKRGTDLPLIKDTFRLDSQKKWTKIVSLIAALVLLFLGYLLGSSFEYKGSVEELIIIIKFSAKIVGIGILVLVLKINTYKDRKITKLKKFEQELLFNNIELVDVKNKYEDQFVSVLLEDWIKKKEKVISDIYEKYNNIEESLDVNDCNEECEQCPFVNTVNEFERIIDNITEFIDQVEYMIKYRILFKAKKDKLENLFNELSELSNCIREKHEMFRSKTTHSRKV